MFAGEVSHVLNCCPRSLLVTLGIKTASFCWSGNYIDVPNCRSLEVREVVSGYLKQSNSFDTYETLDLESRVVQFLTYSSLLYPASPICGEP